ncbi:MAG: hypothetical protein Kow00108_05490 [Calditrichia bacterium]
MKSRSDYIILVGSNMFLNLNIIEYIKKYDQLDFIVVNSIKTLQEIIRKESVILVIFDLSELSEWKEVMEVIGKYKDISFIVLVPGSIKKEDLYPNVVTMEKPFDLKDLLNQVSKYHQERREA